MELTTEGRLASGGEAVARAPDGRVVFVAGAALDERVEVEITETHPRFLRARVLRVLAPGPARVPARCRHFGVCGGCALQHLDAAAQRSAKDEAFAETLRRVGKVDLARSTREPPWAGAPWGYRTRARLAVSEGQLGYRAAASHQVVPVSECPVLAPALAARLPALAEAARAVAGAHELELLLAGERVLGHGDPALLEALGSALDGTEATPDADGRGQLILDASGFAQSNDEGNGALLETVERWTAARPEFAGEVLELYAGSGNFTRVLARRARRVVAVEGSAAAAARARRAMPAHVEVVAAPVVRALSRDGAFDAALADPPRAGLHEQVAEGLRALGVRVFVMVSCDPGTFARDVARLARVGLSLERVRLFDLYPHTAHAEVAGVFVA